MTIVTQFWAPHEDQDELFQAVGTTATWSWGLGDNSFFWSFAVRPRGANAQVEIVRQFTTSDNNLNQVEHFVLMVTQPLGREFRSAGSLSSLQFTAIKVEAT